MAGILVGELYMREYITYCIKLWKYFCPHTFLPPSTVEFDFKALETLMLLGLMRIEKKKNEECSLGLLFNLPQMKKLSKLRTTFHNIFALKSRPKCLLPKMARKIILERRKKRTDKRKSHQLKLA